MNVGHANKTPTTVLFKNHQWKEYKRRSNSKCLLLRVFYKLNHTKMCTCKDNDTNLQSSS